jgi:uncharacterized repeat protein (TIGR01451 family)
MWVEGQDLVTVSESSQTKVIGFTIINGDDGIQIDDSSNIEIADNRILNTIDAIDFKGNSSGIIRDNILENNLDDGIDLNSEAAAVIENNIIRHNDGDGLEMRLQPYSGPTLEVIIRDNLITDNRADGIQLISYDVPSDRYIRIEGNLIKDNNQAGVGLMDNEETNEDYRAASLPEPIDVINNTFIGNNHGLTGGDNLVALNNLFVGHTNIAIKGVDGNSIAAHNLFWNNGTDIQGSNVETNTTVFNQDPLLDANSQLQAGSPAVDAGITFFEWRGETVLDSSSFNGNSLDIGAVESDFLPPEGADLELNQVVNNPIPAAGEEVIFTLTLDNIGPEDTTNVEVTNSLPVGLTFESATASQGTTYNSTNGVWSVGTINSGGDVTLELVATVDTTPTTVITNTAEVTASSEIDPDSTPNNNNPNEDDQASASIGPNVITVTSRVSSSTDDAEESLADGDMSLASSDLELINDDGIDQLVGMRFTNVNIPPGATISNAYIQFQVDETTSDPTQVNIRGEDVNDALTFSNSDFNISSRATTNAVVAWTPSPWETTGEASFPQQTPDIAGVIQEIVDRPGWSLNNSLAIIIDGTGVRTAESYNGDPLGAPLLRVEYINGSPPPVDTADLSLSTSVDNSNPTGGEQITFTITLTNEGPDTATGVTVTDSLPAELSFVSSTPSPGTTYDSNTGLWNVGTVNNGAELTLEITANVIPDTGSFTNTAQVSASNEFDPDSTDDQDTVVVTIEGGSGGPSVFETRVSSSSDDAEESVAGGEMYLNSSDLELINDDGIDQLVGMRFTNVNIPPGATISNAYIQFQVDETTSDPTNLNIRGEDVNDALTFSNSDFNISSRATTNAVVAWTPSPWETTGEASFPQQTPDIAGVIQEIVDRPGWSLNNSLAIIINGTGVRTAESYNGDPLGAPLLHVEWV